MVIKNVKIVILQQPLLASEAEDNGNQEEI